MTARACSIGKPTEGYRCHTQRNLTLGVVGRTWSASREFESHVHHENVFKKKSKFPHAKNLINTLHGPLEIGIINTSYQKLPFGSGDYPDKLLFHQELN